MNKPCNVGVIGFGMVGKEMVSILNSRKFPAKSLRVFARSPREETLDGKTYRVETITDEKVFDDIDIALFAGTEGEKGASSVWGWKAVERGCVVIDNGGDFRMDDRVPLVVPEVNAQELINHKGFIANPNCSTIQMVVVLAPLHREFVIDSVVVSTYQAVSGSGTSAVTELQKQVDDIAERKKCSVYPHPIFSNAIPEIGSPVEEYPGYTTEEVKMTRETRKILNEPDMKITATCVRVPVFNGHSESIHIEFKNEVDIKKVYDTLGRSDGVKVEDDLKNHVYPLASRASGRDETYVGRIRKSSIHPNAIDLWCVSDNIRKGAALNAVQIAEKILFTE